MVADTHSVIWCPGDDPRLSKRAGSAMDKASQDRQPIYVPTVCIVEATYLVEKRRIDPLTLRRLSFALNEPDSPFRAAPLSSEIAFRLNEIPRESVPDLPDRVVAAFGPHTRTPAHHTRRQDSDVSHRDHLVAPCPC